MATMLNGAAVMDAALLLVAGNEPCPQAQTSEHLAAVEIMQLSNIIILQNKIDLVKPEDAIAQRQQIKDFVAGTVAGNAPILPISAQLQYNVDVLAKYIVTHVPVPRTLAMHAGGGSWLACSPPSALLWLALLLPQAATLPPRHDSLSFDRLMSTSLARMHVT